MSLMDNAPVDNGSGGGDVVREQDKIMLILAYLGLFALIPLLTVKDSEYVKWHAKQGIVLAGFGLVLMVITPIPIIGWILGCVGMVGFLIVTIMAIINALKPCRWKIPLVSSIAEKLPL